MIKVIGNECNIKIGMSKYNTAALLEKKFLYTEGATAIHGTDKCKQVQKMIDTTLIKSKTAKMVYEILADDSKGTYRIFIVVVKSTFPKDCTFSGDQYANYGWIPFDPEKKYSIYETKSNVRDTMLTPFDPRVVLFHELGHAWQWKRDRKWYFEMVDELEEEEWYKTLDTDNMKNVEWPICNELSVAKRASYRDIAVT